MKFTNGNLLALVFAEYCSVVNRITRNSVPKEHDPILVLLPSAVKGVQLFPQQFQSLILVPDCLS